MNLMGNDIVDLSALSPRAKSLDSRYLQKVFTSSEQIRIRKSQHPVRMLAKTWALKEAAYKVFVQQGGKRYFRPKDFQVSELPPELPAGILTPLGKLRGKIQEKEAYIHAICGSPEGLPRTWTERILWWKDCASTLQSSLLKEALMKEVSKSHGYSFHDLSISYSSLGIPTLYRLDQLVPLAISMSHDGSWGAFVFSPINSSIRANHPSNL